MTNPAESSMHDTARQLADQFADGWTRGRVDLMMAVFGADPTFLETPFSTPLSGTVAVREWASDIPYHQSEATFSVGEVFIAGPWFSCEFKLVFRRRSTGEWVDARGALFAETDGAKVTELRMYWHRWNGGRETSVD